MGGRVARLHRHNATDGDGVRIKKGSIMESAAERLDRPARGSFAGGPFACDAKNWAGTDEAGALPGPAQGAAEVEIGLTGRSLMSPQTRLAYGLLKAAIGEAVQTVESNRAQFAGKGQGRQAEAIESVYGSALATIELMEALNRAEGPKETAAAQNAQSRREREATSRQIVEFLAAARNMLSVLTAHPSDPLIDCSKAGACPTAPCPTRGVVERLRTLTERQGRVMALVAEGLPNKLIAYELGLRETTVKAHVSEILRKLCVYNRARAIASRGHRYPIRSSALDAKSGGR